MPSQKFLKLLGEMEDIHRRKNAGYAGEESMDPWSNFRMAKMIDISPFEGCLVRMGDKYSRICNLAKDPDNEQVGESIHDTLIDLANYALIAICLYEESSDEIKGLLEDKLIFFEVSLIGKRVKLNGDDDDLVGVISSVTKGRATVKFQSNNSIIEDIPIGDLYLID